MFAVHSSLHLKGFCLLVSCFYLAQLSAQTPHNDTIAAQYLLEKATSLNAARQFLRADTAARNAHIIFQRVLGAHHDKTAGAAYQLGIALGGQSKTEDAMLALREAASIWSTINPNGDERTANAWFQMGRTLETGGNLKDALVYHRQCFDLRQRLLPDDDLQIAASLMEIGSIVFYTESQASAIPYFEKSLDIQIKKNGPESRQVAIELNNLGRAYMYMSDFDKAVELAEKALSIHRKASPPVYRDIIPSCYTLGMCCQHMRRYDDALSYFNNILDIKQKQSPNNLSAFPGTYSEIGKAYLGKKDYRTALAYFEKGDSIMVLLGETENRSYAFTCHDMGKVMYALKRFPESVKWYENDIRLLRKSYQKDNEEIGILLTELANAQTAAGDENGALENFQAAGQIFFDNLGAENASQHLAESGLANLYRQMYLRTRDTAYLHKSRMYFKYADKSVDRLIRFENSPAIRKKWLAETKSIFEQAIATEILFQQYQKDPAALENAWQFSETMHGFELFAASQEANALRFSGIPDNLLQREKNLLANMIDLQKKRRQLIEERHLSLSDSLVLDNNALYFVQKEANTHLVSYLEEHYPDYFHLKYKFSNISIVQTQRMLGAGQTLLEYFTGDSAIYLFVIQPDKSRLVTVPRDFPLNEWVTQFREGILGAQNPGNGYEQSVRQYVQSAQRLYEKLIAPVAAFLSPEVIIIPDGALNYLPFEALLSGTPKDLSNFKTYPFLVREKAIGYNNSTTMLQQMIAQKHQQEPQGMLLAFAPFFFGDTTVVAARIEQEKATRKGLGPLPNTGEEILRARNRLGGKCDLFSGTTATAERFKALAPDFRVLHLATHGKANERTGEFSFLAFYAPADSAANGRLYVSDLYNLTLNADLVLLSACETGMGELFEGEGVVSLARAFSFAGAKSVVTSLWSVNDQSSLFLMDNFYRELKNGKTKNIAMADAKRQYMKEHPAQASHPFFWAGFVGVGDWSKLK